MAPELRRPPAGAAAARRLGRPTCSRVERGTCRTSRRPTGKEVADLVQAEDPPGQRPGRAGTTQATRSSAGGVRERSGGSGTQPRPIRSRTSASRLLGHRRRALVAGHPRGVQPGSLRRGARSTPSPRPAGPFVEALEREGGGWADDQASALGALRGDPTCGAGSAGEREPLMRTPTARATGSTRSTSIPPGTTCCGSPCSTVRLGWPWSNPASPAHTSPAPPCSIPG